MPRIDSAPTATQLAALDARIFAEPLDATAYRDLRAGPAVRAWVLLGEINAGAADAVGAVGEVPAGLLVFQRVLDEAEVYRFGIVPERRGAGLGRWLLERWLTELGADGVLRAHLDVRAGNGAARRLYVRVGFREVGRRPAYYRAPVEDAVLYAWEA